MDDEMEEEDNSIIISLGDPVLALPLDYDNITNLIEAADVVLEDGLNISNVVGQNTSLIRKFLWYEWTPELFKRSGASR